MRMTPRWVIAFAVMCPLVAHSLEVETRREADEFVVKEPDEKDLVDDDGYVLRLSLPTQADIDAWKEPGIRVSLGWIQGHQWSLGPGPSFSPMGAALRPWLRISPEWSLGATFSWQASLTEFSGLKWGATLEPTWHPWRGLGVSLGLGYGGLLGDRTWWLDSPNAMGPPGNQPDPSVSHTIADDEYMSTCQAGAWLALARVEYQFVVGPLFSTGPFAQIDAQRTGCEDASNTDAETGKPIVLKQWWTNAGFNLGWWATWR